MSVSVQSAPTPRSDHGSSKDPDREAARFTSVNGSPTSPPRSFGFRPEDSITVQNQGQVAGHFDNQPPPRPAQQHRQMSGQGIDLEGASRYTIIKPLVNYGRQSNSGKRKRSPTSPSRNRTRNSSPASERNQGAGSGIERRSIESHVHPPVWPSPARSKDDWQPLYQRRTTQPTPEQRLAESLQIEMDAAAAKQDVMSVSPEDDDNVGSSHHGDYSATNGSAPPQEGEQQYRAPRKRQFANRTKTGCHTCRSRKKKCDETKPQCNNCTRGGFFCQGYGENKREQPGGKMPLRPAHKPAHAPATYPRTSQKTTAQGPVPQWPEPYRGKDLSNRRSDIPRYRSLVEEAIYHEQHEDSWSKPSWPAPAPSLYAASQNRYRDQHRLPPVSNIPREQSERLANAARYGTTIAPASDNSRSSVDSARSALTAQMALQQPTQPTASESQRMSEKEKMLVGQPYRHYLDATLFREREECKVALERFNNAARPSAGASIAEQQRLFNMIVDPEPGPERKKDGPIGSVGLRVLVEAPFTCDYGYNINLGDNVVIQSGCVMTDPCKITIGQRTIIGHNVRFYGMTLPTDPKLRNGSDTCAKGGSITIEEDCYIGGDVIILPYRTIRRGSVVEPGTVVNQDVQPNTVVAGNPMRVVRGIGPSDVDQHEPHVQAGNDAAMAAMLSDRYRDGRMPYDR